MLPPAARRHRRVRSVTASWASRLRRTPPNLAAQPSIYLAAQLRAYRSGDRKHEVMSVLSKMLSDADIDNVAAWFSSLQIEVKPVP